LCHLQKSVFRQTFFQRGNIHGSLVVDIVFELSDALSDRIRFEGEVTAQAFISESFSISDARKSKIPVTTPPQQYRDVTRFVRPSPYRSNAKLFMAMLSII
jgi:hypothetical protein